MTQTVYTIYWINRRNDVRKEHGSYASEEEAMESIETWWEIHKEHHRDVEKTRTNTGALEINYGDDNYLYRIEQRETDQPLPSRKYRLRKAGEIDLERAKLNLDKDSLLFDELPEPYRDRIVEAMADGSKVHNFIYNEKGQPVIKVADYKRIHQV